MNMYMCVGGGEREIIAPYCQYIRRALKQRIAVVVQSFSHSDSSQSHGLHYTRLPCLSLSPWVCSNSSPLSRWCHPTISSSDVPFSSCLQSFPSIRIFSSESVLCMMWPKYWSFSISPSNQYSGLISLLSKGLSGVFSSTTVWKHQLFGAQPSLWSNSYICTWLLEKP